MTIQAGEVEVAVKANTTQYTQGMNKAKGDATKFSQQATAATEKAGSSFQRLNALSGALGSRLGLLGQVARSLTAGLAGTAVAVGVLAGVAGLGALLLVSSPLLKAFAEFESRQLTLQNVLKATGATALGSARDYEALTNALVQATGASSAGITQAVTIFAQSRISFGNDINQMIQLSQDLASSGFGTIERGAAALAQALNNPAEGLRALRQAGIFFSASQIKVIDDLRKTGQAAEANKKSLELLQGTVGGASQTSNSGITGAFTRLANATAAWAVSIGSVVANALKLPDLFNSLAASAEKAAGLPQTIDQQIASAKDGLEGLRLKQNQIIDSMQRLREGPNTIGSEDKVRQLGREYAKLNLEIRAVEQRLTLLNSQGMSKWIMDGAAQAAQERNAVKQRVDEVTTALKEQADVYKRTALAQKIYEEQRKATVTPESIEGKQIAALVRQEDQLKRVHAKREAAITQYPEYLRELQREIDIMKTGDPVMQEMIRRRELLGDKITKQTEAVKQLLTVQTQLRTISDASEAVFSGMTNALVEFATTGKFEFKKMADGIIADLLRIAMRAFVTSKIIAAISNLASNIPGLGAPAGGANNANIPMGGGAGANIQGYAAGGTFRVPGSGSGDRPTLVGLAPGELVQITPQHKVAGGMGNNSNSTTVNVTTNSSGEQKVETSERQGEGGERVIEIMVSEVQKRMGRGDFDGTMGGRFGVAPKTARR